MDGPHCLFGAISLRLQRKDVAGHRENCEKRSLMKPSHAVLPLLKHLFISIKRPLRRSKGREMLDLRTEKSGTRESTTEKSFFVADLDCVTRQFDLWKTHMPTVRPFYAVKCNPDSALLQRMAQLGASFDCASIQEIQSVLGIGVHPDRILFANPCKAASALRFAASVGVSMTTFDNLSELENIKTYMPNARLLLRIFANDKTALVALGDKYGAPEHAVPSLLRKARSLDLKVIGTSFHIGSGASDPEAYRAAIQSSRSAWIVAQSLDIDMTILDIGGGFLDNAKSFILMTSAVKNAIREACFPEGTTIIAEPGRFFARRAYTLVSEVLSLRQPTESVDSNQPGTNGSGMVYQNDGVYQSFMNRLVEKEEYHPILIQVQKAGIRPASGSIPSTYSIWGPTCDSTDLISTRAVFDRRVQVGDWLVYRDMGAYTFSTSTAFNGFPAQRDVVYVDKRLRRDNSLKPQLRQKLFLLRDDRFCSLRSLVLGDSR